MQTPLRSRISSLAPEIRELGGGTIRAASVTAASVFASFGAQLFLARALGPGPLGDFTLAVAITTAVTTLAGIGIPRSSLRFIPLYKEQHQLSLLTGFLRFSARLPLLSVLFLSALITTLLWMTPSAFSPGTRLALLLLPALAFIMLSLELQTFRLRALKSVTPAVLSNSLLRPLFFVPALLLTMALTSKPLSGATAIVAYTAALLAVLIFALSSYRRQLRRTNLSDLPLPTTEHRIWLSAAAPLLISNVLITYMAQLDLILLGVLFDSRAVGLYSIALRISTLVLFGLEALNVLLVPLMSQLLARNDLPRLQRLITTGSAGIFLFAAITYTCIVLFRQPILRFFGPDFAQATAFLLILATAGVARATLGPAGGLLQVAGRERSHSITTLLALLLKILLLLALVPSLGVIGIAVSAACTLTFQNLAYAYLVRRLLSVDTTIWSALRQVLDHSFGVSEDTSHNTPPPPRSGE